jgi:hypothetical protein
MRTKKRFPKVNFKWSHVCSFIPVSVLPAVRHLYCWQYGICTAGCTTSVLLAVRHLYCWQYDICTAGSTANTSAVQCSFLEDSRQKDTPETI